MYYRTTEKNLWPKAELIITPLFFLFENKIFSISILNIWDKIFKNGPSKICGRQPLKI